ncbi:MAG: Kelch repeat-containing protein [Armatimonadota bacterium]
MPQRESRPDTEARVRISRREALGGLGAGLVGSVLTAAPAEAAPRGTAAAPAPSGPPVTPEPRAHHTATLLQDGRVLVAGGFHRHPLASALLFDPIRKSWHAVAPMCSPRARHAAAALPDGRVLVVGGVNTMLIAGAEVYDPVRNSWTPVASPGAGRADAAAVTLADGRVLLSGGEGRTPGAIELYDPFSDTWSTLG